MDHVSPPCELCGAPQANFWLLLPELLPDSKGKAHACMRSIQVCQSCRKLDLLTVLNREAERSIPTA